MAVLRLDHASVVVTDLDAAVAFFTELGLELEGTQSVEGPAVDRLCGLEGVRADIAMVRTPDGHGRLELTRYRSPSAVGPEPAAAPVNTVGLRSLMFAVDDLHDAVARLAAHGAEPVGEVVEYEHAYRLCYLRGPGDVIVALAQELG